MSTKKKTSGVATAAAAMALALMVPAAAKAWDPVRDLTGRNATNLVKHHAEKLQVAVGRAIEDPAGYVLGLPKSLLADICSAPVQYYEGTLRGQASGRMQALPPQLIAAVQSDYPNARLDAVRYATGIRTSNGAAQTFGHEIYFPRNLNLTNPNDLHWMLHELEHTQQFARAGSQASKLCEYMGHAVGNGLRHDSIPMEQAADRKADFLLDRALDAMTGGAARAQSAMATSGPGLAPHQLAVVNDTAYPVYFTLASKWTPPTNLELQPGASEVYPTHPDDGEFQISVTSNGQTLGYNLGGGTVVHLRWNQHNLLDVFAQ